MKNFIFLFLIISFSVSPQEFPVLKKYANDFTKTIEQNQLDYLDSGLRTFDDSTSNQVVFLMINTLDGYPIEMYTYETAEKNNIGTKENDNGVLFFVAKNDRKMRIEVGYGLEGAIPDSVAGRVRDSYMISNFKEGKYFDGIYEASQALSFKIAKSMNIELSGISDDVQSNEEMNDWINQHPLRFLAIIVFALFLVVILGAIFGSGSGGGYSGGYYSGGSSGGFGGGSSFGGGSFGGGGCSGGW